MKKIVACTLGFGSILLNTAIYAADGTAYNRTSSFATAHIGFTCSSAAGNDGILKPHSSISIPKSALDIVCHGSSSCKANVYMTKNCTGTKIATVIIDDSAGKIVSITNYSDTYHITAGSDITAYIDGP